MAPSLGFSAREASDSTPAAPMFEATVTLSSETFGSTLNELQVSICGCEDTMLGHRTHVEPQLTKPETSHACAAAVACSTRQQRAARRLRSMLRPWRRLSLWRLLDSSAGRWLWR